MPLAEIVDFSQIFEHIFGCQSAAHFSYFSIVLIIPYSSQVQDPFRMNEVCL